MSRSHDRFAARVTFLPMTPPSDSAPPPSGLHVEPGAPVPLVVIGAGAAGLLTAIFAARAGVPTRLLETRPRPGAKIRVSGGGRCNVLPSVMTVDDFHTEGSRNTLDTPLAEFKKGSQIIAVKNRLQMLPVFIRDNTNTVLMESIKHNTKGLKVTIEIGDLIDYKDRSRTLEEAYKHQFNL